MPAINRKDVEAVISNWKTVGGTEGDWDLTLEHEVQTDKDRVKLVPCRECKRPLVVTTFFAPAKAICRSCKGGDSTERNVLATVGQPIPGQTDPAKAVNLEDCLINKHFAFAVCPVHPEDPEHVMELKAVNHSPHYGPGHYNAKGAWIQDAPGEVAVHQCTKCFAVATYQTTIRAPYRRQNEPRTKPDTGAPERHYIFGLNGKIPETEVA